MCSVGGRPGSGLRNTVLDPSSLKWFTGLKPSKQTTWFESFLPSFGGSNAQNQACVARSTLRGQEPGSVFYHPRSTGQTQFKISMDRHLLF